MCSCTHRSARVLVSVEEVERHPDDFGLHLADAGEGVGVERVGVGREVVGRRHRLHAGRVRRLVADAGQRARLRLELALKKLFG